VYASQSLPLALPGGASPYAPPIRVALSDEHGDSLLLQMMAVVECAQNILRSFTVFATEGEWKPVRSLLIYAEGACKVERPASPGLGDDEASLARRRASL
jgi:hypothetical protein